MNLEPHFYHNHHQEWLENIYIFNQRDFDQCNILSQNLPVNSVKSEIGLTRWSNHMSWKQPWAPQAHMWTSIALFGSQGELGHNFRNTCHSKSSNPQRAFAIKFWDFDIFFLNVPTTEDDEMVHVIRSLFSSASRVYWVSSGHEFTRHGNWVVGAL